MMGQDDDGLSSAHKKGVNNVSKQNSTRFKI